VTAREPATSSNNLSAQKHYQKLIQMAFSNAILHQIT
jgi:hypothetical protein